MKWLYVPGKHNPAPLTLRGCVCAAEAGDGEEAEGGEPEPAPAGLGPQRPAAGAAAGEAEQAAEETPGQRQRSAGPDPAAGVSGVRRAVTGASSPQTDAFSRLVSRRPDLKRGRIDDVFFAQFNTCSR